MHPFSNMAAAACLCCRLTRLRTVSNKLLIYHSRTFTDLSKTNIFPRPNLAWLEHKAEVWLQAYEDFVGLTEVKAAQNKVIEVRQKVEGDRATKYVTRHIYKHCN